jgi:hypothetical protein
MPFLQKTSSVATVPECVLISSTNDDATDGYWDWMRHGSLALENDTNKVLEALRSTSNHAAFGGKGPYMLNTVKQQGAGTLKGTNVSTAILIEDDDFFSQPGTNFNEQDHSDWTVSEDDDDDDDTLDETHHHQSFRDSSAGNQPLQPDGHGPPPPRTGPGTDPNYYIFSSVILPTTIQPLGIQFARTASDNQWDVFLAALHCAVVSVQSDPSTATPAAPLNCAPPTSSRRGSRTSSAQPHPTSC